MSKTSTFRKWAKTHTSERKTRSRRKAFIAGKLATLRETLSALVIRK